MRNYLFTILCFLLGPLTTSCQTAAPSDPSGRYHSEEGELSIMLGDGELHFSFFAVFGATAHICDGAGIARKTTGNSYHYKDTEGVIAFDLRSDGIQMATIDGIASFCGAGWTGDFFANESREAPTVSTVQTDKSYFYSIHTSPHERTSSYVIRGDAVETLPASHGGSDNYVLARFKGASTTTIGLLQASTLDHP